LVQFLRIGFDLAQVFSAQRAIRNEVVTILDDMFVKCQNGAVEPGIVDRDVPALTVSPGTGLQQSLPEFDPSLLASSNSKRKSGQRLCECRVAGQIASNSGSDRLSFLLPIEDMNTSFLWLA
jgi:hypothetical protein